jgi:Cu2+-exporting ATPase
MVHEFIETGGLGSFYQLLGNRKLEPATSLSLPVSVVDDLGEAIGEAESLAGDSDGLCRLTLRVANLSCTACVWLIERLHRELDGALKISANTNRSTVTLWWRKGDFNVLGFVNDLYRFGYPVTRYNEEDDERSFSQSRGLITRLGVTGGLAMNTMAFTLPRYLGMEADNDLARLFSVIAFGSSTLAVLVGGSFFFQRAIASLRLGALHMDTPVSLGLVSAWMGSLVGALFGIERLIYFDFVATFAFLMLGGRWLHLRLLEKNRRQLRSRERDATSLRRFDANGQASRISFAQVAEADELEIPPGALVPVRSSLGDSGATLMLDWINGEPEPVRFTKGQTLPAGARNHGTAAVRVTALDEFSGSLLETLMQSSPEGNGEEETASSNPILKGYLTAVLIVAFLGGCYWIARGAPAGLSLQVFVSILIVSCPCAIGLALPLLDELVLGRLKSEGIYVRRASLWKRVVKVRIIACDKTGTLTHARQVLLNPEILDTLTASEIHALHVLTFRNYHPVGQAISEALISRWGPARLLGATPSEVSGSGVEWENEESVWRLGRRTWATGQTLRDAVEECVLAVDGVVHATFTVGESLREGAALEIQSLTRSGYEVRILSGDPDRERVLRSARELGIPPENVLAGCSPEGKAESLRGGQGEKTLYIGDGGNDSLAFQAALATGAPATGIRVIEGQADFVFTGRGFHAVSRLLEAAGLRRKLVRLIFGVAIAYNLAAIGVCLAGKMNPLLAAVLMPLSSVVTMGIAMLGQVKGNRPSR